MGHGGGAHDEGGVDTVKALAYASQPTKDNRRMTSERSAVGVRLIHDHESTTTNSQARRDCKRGKAAARRRGEVVHRNRLKVLWCGKIEQCSMSGLLISNRACLRSRVRSAWLVSPSYTPTSAPSVNASRALSARSWSCASALVGNMYSAHACPAHWTSLDGKPADRQREGDEEERPVDPAAAPLERGCYSKATFPTTWRWPPPHAGHAAPRQWPAPGARTTAVHPPPARPARPAGPRAASAKS
eukprot:scaffold842_cov357-Prasinococcus_capsulatus_cf.AAC.1